MIRNFLKCILIGAMITGGAATAVAQDGPVAVAHGLKPVVADSFVKVNARYAQYFGQLDTGKEGETAHFKNYGETGVQFSGGVGNARFFVDTEARSGTQDLEFYDVIARASYVTPVGMVTIGKVTNYMGQLTTNPGGGVKASHGGLGSQSASTAAGNFENDGIDLMIPLMDKSLIFEFTMWDKAAGKFRTLAPVRSGGEGLGQSEDGSATAFGVMYRGGPIMVKAGMTTETMDDYSTDADTAETNTYNMVSAKLTFGDFAIDVSSSSADMKGINKLTMASEILDGLDATTKTTVEGILGGLPDAEVKATVVGLGLTAKDLGPGDLHINYEGVTMTDTNLDTLETMYDLSGNATLAQLNLDKKVAKLSMFYSIYVSEKIGYQIVYDQKVMTPTFGDPNTRSFIGASLFGFF